MTSKICNICTNKKKHQITCISCEKYACKTCYTKYFLELNEDTTNCMYCKKQFDIEFLLGNDENNKQRFSKNFIWGDLKKHREKILFEQFMAKMPMYQKIASAKNEIIKINEKIRDLKKQINELHGLLRVQTIVYNNASDSDNNTKTGVNYITRGKCPKDGCNGYIEEGWECGICKSKICSKCMMEKKDEHECNEEDLQSAVLIRESTKPCPSCRTRIYKSEGCNQMWCTNCHVFFCWNTGKIIVKTQFVHNPHYIEFQRQNGIKANNLNNGCGEIGIYDINNFKIPDKYKKIFTEYFRKSEHILNYVHRYIDPLQTKQREISIKFLNNELNKKDLIRSIQRYEKASKKEELANIRRVTYANTIKDILNNCKIELNARHSTVQSFNRDSDTEEEYGEEYEKEEEEERKIIEEKNIKTADECIKRIINLDKYMNKNMRIIGDMFSTIDPRIDPGFNTYINFRGWNDYTN